jgi:hypothetical protein
MCSIIEFTNVGANNVPKPQPGHFLAVCSFVKHNKSINYRYTILIRYKFICIEGRSVSDTSIHVLFQS